MPASPKRVKRNDNRRVLLFQKYGVMKRFPFLKLSISSRREIRLDLKENMGAFYDQVSEKVRRLREKYKRMIC